VKSVSLLLTKRKEKNPGGHAKLSGFFFIAKQYNRDCGKKSKQFLSRFKNRLHGYFRRTNDLYQAAIKC
jgi:hypothetical protein